MKVEIMGLQTEFRSINWWLQTLQQRQKALLALHQVFSHSGCKNIKDFVKLISVVIVK